MLTVPVLHLKRDIAGICILVAGHSDKMCCPLEHNVAYVSESHTTRNDTFGNGIFTDDMSLPKKPQQRHTTRKNIFDDDTFGNDMSCQKSQNDNLFLGGELF